MKDFDNVMKSLISACLIGLSVWVFNINADVRVQSNEISHIQESQKESILVNRELTKAVTELRIVIEKIRR
tara:strand:- start:9525 stop:9737 length:213 start_codon:yes stop_codon:yes gene_type:complete